MRLSIVGDATNKLTTLPCWKSKWAISTPNPRLNTPPRLGLASSAFNNGNGWSGKRPAFAVGTADATAASAGTAVAKGAAVGAGTGVAVADDPQATASTIDNATKIGINVMFNHLTLNISNPPHL